VKVYVAAPWVCRREARVAAEALEADGFTVVSRWLYLHGDSKDAEILAREAQNDVDDLDASDALVLLNLEKSEGKAVETGLALATGKPVIVVGARSNIFHWLPRVQIVNTVQEAAERLRRNRDRAA
jgi:nucleoside 2-deoxyribosyltransferase